MGQNSHVKETWDLISGKLDVSQHLDVVAKDSSKVLAAWGHTQEMVTAGVAGMVLGVLAQIPHVIFSRTVQSVKRETAA